MKDERIASEGRASLDRVGDDSEQKLPRRDWILLPLISLLTIVASVGSLELIARWMLSSVKTSYTSCFNYKDPQVGVRAIPNSTCIDKVPEGELAEYRFNSCGYRTDEGCGSKPPGTYRIVLTGSSIALGLGVPIEETIATRLSKYLSQQNGRKIDIYNEGSVGWGGSPRSVAVNFGNVLSAQPDLVLWIVTPFDIDHMAKDSTLDAPKSLLGTMHEYLVNTGFVMLLTHFLYQSQYLYVRAYLMGGKDVSLLKLGPARRWQAVHRQFGSYAETIEAQAKVAGVPLVVVLVPNGAQAAMISMGEWPAGYDPYKLDNELRNIIVRQGGIYIDILSDFRNIPNPEQYYFPVDGHPNAEGHAIIADFLAKALTNGSVPALRAASRPPHEPTRGN